jgi:putative ABC transport system permease protein
MVLMLAATPADIPRIKEEYQVVVKNFQPAQIFSFRPNLPVKAYSHALSKAGMYTQLIAGNSQTYEDIENKNNNTILQYLGVAALMFMLLPVINLMNINISRILERSSEIGVRKSFGASSGHLVRQFIVENLLITVIGGLLGFMLAILALSLLSSSGLLAGETFAFNYRIFALGFLYILVFGLLSGVYPSWLMSRLDPVRALKGAIS